MEKATEQEGQIILRSLFNNRMNGIAYGKMVLNKKGKPVDYIFLDINDAFENFTGLKRKKVIGKKATQVMPGIEKEKFDYIGVHGQVAMTGKATHFTEYNSFLKRWYSTDVYYLKKGYFLSIFTDITKQKDTQKALQQSEEKFRQLFETMVEGVVYQDRTGGIILANRAATNILGLTGKQLSGKDSFDGAWKAIDGDGNSFDGNKHPAMVALKTGKPVTNVTMGVYNRKEKKHRWIVINAMPLFREGEKKPYMVYTSFDDITEQRTAEEALKRSERRFRLIAENAPDIISRLNRDLKIVFISPNIEKAMGIKPEELVGRNYCDPEIPKEICQDFEKAAAYLKKHPQHNGPVITDYAMETPMGNRFFQSRSVPEYDNKGKLISMLVFTRDISAIKEFERRKDEFISIASHELKTPLTSIKAYGQIVAKLMADKDQPTVTEYLDRMNKQISTLQEYVNDLLDVNKLQAGKLPLSKTTFDLKDLVLEIANSFSAASMGHSIQLRNIHKTMIVADRERIGQVLNNLLSNAVKYSPKADKVIVSMKNDNKQATVSVRDFGIGIEKEQQSKVFDRFYQVSGIDRTKFSGLGLGLYICKGIIERHEGKIWIKSKKGAGTTFSFSLPK